MSSDTRGVDRRGFLALAGAGIALIAGFSNRAQAASSGPSVTVWQLDPNWGYPRGPHAKTRLVSRASRRAAQNRIALSEQEALDMNLHLCSFAPAVAHTVCAATFADAWQRRSYEWTNPWNGSVVRVLDRRHLSTVDAARLDGPCVPAGDEPASLGTGTGGPSAPGDPGGTLPFTGGAQRNLAAAGLAALISGVIAIRRGEAARDDPGTGSDSRSAANR